MTLSATFCPPSTSETFVEDMPQHLVVRYQQVEDGTKVEVDLWGGRAWIGRLRFLRLHVNSKGVSELHAKVEWDAATRTWLLSDNDSTNGTKLNGQSLKPGQKHALHNGDAIVIGGICSFAVEVKPLQTMKELLRAHAKACFHSHCEANEEACIRAHRTQEDARTEVCELLGLPEDKVLELMED